MACPRLLQTRGKIHAPAARRNFNSRENPHNFNKLDVFHQIPWARLSLTFGRRGGLTPALLEKTFFSSRRPALETGGQRPTARCALGRKIVWNIRHAEAMAASISLAPHFAGRGLG